MIVHGDALKILSEMQGESMQMCVTSPPYWGLRDYESEGQLGQEPSFEDYIQKLVNVFAQVRRVLKKDGTLWLNIGDSYADSGRGGNSISITGEGKNKSKGKRATRGTLKRKDLVGIPWRVAFALQADGWYLRQDIIWSKPNPMPESVGDRCTKAHEYLFLLSKSKLYYFDNDAIKERAVCGWNSSKFHVGKSMKHQLGRASKKRGEFKGKGAAERGREPFRATTDYRNKRSVWTVGSKPFKGAHFATFPPKLIEPCILAGSREGDWIIDPFFGAGTTGLVAQRLRRKCVGIEINADYVTMAAERMEADFAPLVDIQSG